MSTPEQARRELAQSIETLITNGRYIDADAIAAAIEALIDAKLAERPTPFESGAELFAAALRARE